MRRKLYQHAPKVKQAWTEDTGAIESIVSSAGEVETVEVTPSSGLFAGPRLFLRIQAD